MPAGRPVILVVEDDADTRSMLVTALRVEIDARVISAANGRAALDVIALNAPSVVLLDLNIPLVHGLDVVRQLKSRPQTASIPVVALTAETRHRLALEAGCDDVVAKPFLLDDLLARLQRWLPCLESAPSEGTTIASCRSATFTIAPLPGVAEPVPAPG